MSSKFSHRERLWKLRIFNTVIINAVIFFVYYLLLNFGVKIGLALGLVLILGLVFLVKTTLRTYLDPDEEFTNDRPMEKWLVIGGVLLLVMTDTVSIIHLIRKVIAIHLIISIYILRSRILKKDEGT